MLCATLDKTVLFVGGINNPCVSSVRCLRHINITIHVNLADRSPVCRQCVDVNNLWLWLYDRAMCQEGEGVGKNIQTTICTVLVRFNGFFVYLTFRCILELGSKIESKCDYSLKKKISQLSRQNSYSANTLVSHSGVLYHDLLVEGVVIVHYIRI